MGFVPERSERQPMVRPASLLARPLLAAALVVGLGTAAQAQTQTIPNPTTAEPLRNGDGPRLTQAQRQKIFPDTRALAVQDHRARIVILQQGERCLAAAANGDALRACMRQERQAMQAQHQQHREALRQVFVRNGLPVPDWSKRQGGPGGRPGVRPGGGAYGWDQPGQPQLQPLR